MANINWNFITEKEGDSQNVGYVPENSDKSGVTIASGFDLGQQTEDTIKNFGFKDPTILNVIRPYLGLRGDQAKEVAPNLVLSDEQKSDIDSTVKSFYQNSIEQQFNSKKRLYSFDQLDPAVQTAITSVGYQYGDLRRTPRFFNAALDNNVEGIIDELKNFDDSYPTRRNSEANYIINNISDENLKKNLNVAFDPLNPSEKFGELYMDRVFKTWQYKPPTEASFMESFAVAAKLNQIGFAIYRSMTVPTFEPDINFSLKNNEKEIKKILEENNIQSEYYNEFVGSVSLAHFLSKVDRVKYEQEQRAFLESQGWKGLAADLGSFFLDPVALISGIGVTSKLIGAGTYLSRASRMERFTKAGLVVGAEQGLLTAVVAAESPTLDINTVLIASALGGTLGGGISAIRKTQLSRVAKDIQAAELSEEGIKLTKKGEEVFADVKVSKISQDDIINTSDPLDPSVIIDKELIFPRIRNLPLFNIIPISKSSALGGSKSDLARTFAFNTLEDSIGYRYKGGGSTRSNIVSQPDTVEVIKDLYLHKYLTKTAVQVSKILDDYLREQGMTGVMGFFQRNLNFKARQNFMTLVARAIRTFDPQNKNLEDAKLLNNPHIAKAANVYADAFEDWAKTLREKGIEGADFNINRGYIPRRLSFEKYYELLHKKNIKESDLRDLIIGAILDRQKYMSVTKPQELKAALGVKEARGVKKTTNLPDDQRLGAEWQKKIREEELKKMAGNASSPDYISPEKASLMADAILTFIKNSRRATGFDLEALLRTRDPQKLTLYLKEALPHLSDADISKMTKALGNEISTITSGRLVERIKLNESFSIQVRDKNGNLQTLRLDDLYDNNVDALFNDYTQEMSGWAALSDKLGIKSRDDWYATSNKIINDIELKYDRTKVFQNIRANEEIETLTSVFQNLLGRSAEVDPNNPWSKFARNIRRYNFVRVLNQVGIASLPELGNIISAAGIKTFVQNIPEFKSIVRDMQRGKPLRDTVFKELATINYGNGDEALHRISHSLETLDQNTATHSLGSSLKSSNILSALEKTTTWTSGLTPVDMFLRKLATRTFVDKFADDMFKLKNSNFNFSSINLNRYKVLGFTESELKKFAKEFTNGTVTTEATFWGTKVKQFNFANWSDQDLLITFANRLNRHTKRTVQYNFIGDSQRFFSDTTTGKMLSQFRQFIITAWSKQFLHNIALADFRTFSTFSYTSLLATLAYLGQTHFNALGMGDKERAEYFEKRFGVEGDYTRLGLAAFQRTGWSSLMPMYADIVSLAIAPDLRFNTRSSGLEVNLITGNPTYDLFATGGRSLLSILKTARDDYSFSKTDLKRITRLFVFQNSFGVSNVLNLFLDKVPLPDESKEKLY